MLGTKEATGDPHVPNRAPPRLPLQYSFMLTHPLEAADGWHLLKLLKLPCELPASGRSSLTPRLSAVAGLMGELSPLSASPITKTQLLRLTSNGNGEWPSCLLPAQHCWPSYHYTVEGGTAATADLVTTTTMSCEPRPSSRALSPSNSKHSQNQALHYG